MALLQAGQIAPDFDVQTDTGEVVKLSDFRGKRVVLYFYPQSDTPGCTLEACAFRDSYSEYQAKDVVVLGASPDTEDAQAAFKTKYQLPFTLLADADHNVAELYGVWDHWTFTGRNGRDVEFTGIYRSTFLIDEDGKIIDVLYGIDAANHSSEVLSRI